MANNTPIEHEVTSIRSFNHQLYTYKNNKVCLTSYYDKMEMLDQKNCVPVGFKKVFKIENEYSYISYSYYQ